MNLFAQIREIIVDAINELVKDGELPEGLSLANISVEPPRDSSHGDVATNVAMVLAKPAKQNPRNIAGHVVKKLEGHELITSIAIAGPGFINLTLEPSLWTQLIQAIIEQKVSYGDSNLGKGAKVNLEYVSANPTGPMHIGHARGAVYGDALAGLLNKAGFDVTKEYYINDAGSQTDVLAKSAYLRYLEALGEDIGDIPEGLYPGEYLKQVGVSLVEQYGDSLKAQPEEAVLLQVKQHAIESMMRMIKSDLKGLGIEHDVFSSEYTLHKAKKIEESLALLQDHGLLYEGVLEPPKGKKPEDWEARQQTLFKATDFGDDIDRPVKKSDGSFTYFAADMAYHLDKYRRGFNQMIVILGADHGGYVKRLQAAVKALSNNEAAIDAKICQLVNFLEDGKPVKMSKRAGTFTTVRDVVDLVGKDVVRFIMLTRKNDAVLDFDLAKVTEQSKDNPVFYVQYAHARAKSVIRNAKELDAFATFDVDTIDVSCLSLLTDEAELELVKLLAQWPRIVELAASANEPHRIAFYLQDVAASFHALWSKGKENTLLRFIHEDNVALTHARLTMIQAMTYVIASGLQIFCIEPLDEMR